MQEQSKVGKKSEINKQFHVKSWLTYRSYRSARYLFSCSYYTFMNKLVKSMQRSFKTDNTYSLDTLNAPDDNSSHLTINQRSLYK